MKLKLAYIIIFLMVQYSFSQEQNWVWTEIAPLPIATTNNAIATATVSMEKYVYSFGGIQNPLTHEDVHQEVFKYDVSENQWAHVSTIPDTLGKINFSTSLIGNKMFLIGGEHRLANNNVSSNKVHVYNVFLDTFELNANPLPFPVHSQVQAAWRDSLIFVISGISNGNILNEVQIFNPTFDSWQTTPLPTNGNFSVANAKGYILGDTIFYYGGVNAANPTTPNSFLRKGIINPNDPTDIEWELIQPNPILPHFNGASSGHDHTLFWIGGAKDSHLYNGINVDDNEIVPPLKRIIEYNLKTKQYRYEEPPHGVKDLNSTAKLGGGNWIIAGGIDSLNTASDKVYLLHNSSLADYEKAQKPPYFQILSMNDYFIAQTENVGEILVYDLQGRTLYKSTKQLADLYIPKHRLTNNMLFFVYEDGFNLPVVIKRINP